MQYFRDFLSGYPTQLVAKGHIIVHQGDIPDYAYIIKSGFVKIYDITTNGDEKPIHFDQELETFPIAWVLGSMNNAQLFYEALTDCELYLVPRKEYTAFLHNNADVQFKLFRHFIERYNDFQLRILALEQLKANDKILYTLKFLLARFGNVSAHNADEWNIAIPLTQQDFANFVGLTRETTGIELKKLERKGIVRYSRQAYIVNKPKLTEQMDE